MSTVIEAKRWHNKATGQTASVMGACPWTRESDRPNWVMESVGFTVLHPDGTTGLGRVPFATFAEAQDWCNKNRNFRGMSQG